MATELRDATERLGLKRFFRRVLSVFPGNAFFLSLIVHFVVGGVLFLFIQILYKQRPDVVIRVALVSNIASSNIEYQDSLQAKYQSLATKIIKIQNKRTVNDQLFLTTTSLPNVKGGEQNSESGELYNEELHFFIPYPRISRLLGEEGVVTFTRIKKEGASADVFRIATSSGFTRLDNAAKQALDGSINDNLLKSKNKFQKVKFVFKLKN